MFLATLERAKNFSLQGNGSFRNMCACAVLGRAATPPAVPCEPGRRALLFVRTPSRRTAGARLLPLRIYYMPCASIIEVEPENTVLARMAKQRKEQ